MLQEMKLEDALKKFLQGKKVLVMYNETLVPEKNQNIRLKVSEKP